jgi:hypothetical protein
MVPAFAGTTITAASTLARVLRRYAKQKILPE